MNFPAIIGQSLMWLAAAFAILIAVYYQEAIVAQVERVANVGSKLATPSDVVAYNAPPEAESIGGTVSIPADGHGHYSVSGRVNQHDIDFMVDTGASYVVLNYDDAKRAGLWPQNLEFSGRAQTANGVSRMAPVTLDSVQIGNIVVHDVPAAVAEPGALEINLLGMSFLHRLSGFQVKNDELVLNR
jgi:aspartyl protease family protein